MDGTQKDVWAYRDISNEVKKEMWDIVVGLQQNLVKKTRYVEEGRATNNNGDDSSIGAKKKKRERSGNTWKHFQEKGYQNLSHYQQHV